MSLIPLSRLAPGDQGGDSGWLEWIGPAADLDPEQAEAVFATLAKLGAFRLMVHAIDRRTVIATTELEQSREELRRAVQGAAPDWDVVLTEPPRPRGSQCLLAWLSRSAPAWTPLPTVATYKADFLHPLLSAVEPLAADESFTLGYLAQPIDAETRSQLQYAVTKAKPTKGFWEALEQWVNDERVPAHERPFQRLLDTRLAGPLFLVNGIACLRGSSQARLRSHLRSLQAVFDSFNAGFGGLSLKLLGNTQAELTAAADSIVIAGNELAALVHAPSRGVSAPGVTFKKLPTLPLSTSTTETAGLLLGTASSYGVDVPVYLPWEDLHASHLAIPSGRTGSGKSTLLGNCIDQFARSSERPGIIVIDPHGLLALSVARSIPPDRVDDVVLWEMNDQVTSIGLPVFQRPKHVSAEVFAQTTFAVFKLLFEKDWSETRLEDACYAVCATLCERPGSTLLDIGPLLLEDSFRHQATARVSDWAAQEFWSTYERLSDGAKLELARPVLNRVRRLYRSATVRAMLCRNDGIDLGSVINHGGILLVSLAGESISAHADLLGELLLARIHLELFAALGQPERARRRMYVAIDESHRFQSASLPRLLSETRKLNTTLLLGTQVTNQWTDQLAQAVLGNVGTLICFGAGPEDSQRLAKSLRPYTAEMLEGLDRFVCVIRMQVHGQTMPPIAIRTLPPQRDPDEATLERIRTQSRQRYGLPRAQVEASFSRDYASIATADRRVIYEE